MQRLVMAALALTAGCIQTSGAGADAGADLPSCEAIAPIGAARFCPRLDASGCRKPPEPIEDLEDEVAPDGSRCMSEARYQDMRGYALLARYWIACTESAREAPSDTACFLLEFSAWCEP